MILNYQKGASGVKKTKEYTATGGLKEKQTNKIQNVGKCKTN